MRRVLLALAVVAVVGGGFGAGYYVGSHADDTRVPNLLGLGTEDGGQAAARRALATVGLRIGKVGWMVCASDENGLVVRQNPPAGTIVPKGATVNVSIGDNGTRLIGVFGTAEPCLPGHQHPAGLPPNEARTETLAVPDVTGLSPASASRLIQQAGLIAEAVDLPAAHGRDRLSPRCRRPVPWLNPARPS